MRPRRKAQIETASSPSLCITGTALRVSLMLVFILFPEVSVQSTRTFDSQSDCDSVLGSDWKRHGTSKYLYPADWNKQKHTVKYNEIKSVCSEYGLTLPSAYNMKDWLSLQEIARDYAKYRIGANLPLPLHAFFLGEYFEGTRIVDTNGDPAETFIIWSIFEPSGDGKTIAMRLEKSAKTQKYYIKANDVGDNPNDSSMSGRVVCMYPKNSYCFDKSSENEETKKDKLQQEPYFLGRVGELYYLWINLNPRYPVKGPLDEFCMRPSGTKPPSVGWLSDFGSVLSDAAEAKPLMDELNKKLESLDIYIPSDGAIGFVSDDEFGPMFWNSKVPQFERRSNPKHLVQFFSLCIYRFPVETCD